MALQFDTILSAANVVGYYNANPRDIKNHPLLTLFPPTQQVGLDITSIKGAHDAPVMLRPSAFDTNPPIRVRGTAETIQLKLPLWREEMPIKEEDRQKLLMYGATNNPFVNQAIADIYDDRANLIDGATAARIRMAGQALSTGTVSLTAEGVTVAASYGYDAGTQTTTLGGGDLWSAASTATPISDLLAAKKAAKLMSANVYMNQATFIEMIACDEVTKTVYQGGYAGKILEGDVKGWLATQGLYVVILDGMIETNTYSLTLGGTEYDFYPNGYVTVAPRSPLGKMRFGTTPEQADLMAGVGDVKSIEITDTGVAVVSLIKAGPPVQISTVVSQIVLPSFESVAKIQIIIV